MPPNIIQRAMALRRSFLAGAVDAVDFALKGCAIDEELSYIMNGGVPAMRQPVSSVLTVGPRTEAAELP